MARCPRLIIEKQPHHVVQRGHNRKPVFFAEEDYLYYKECLKTAAAQYGCTIHAYCLMTNHVHLLVTPETKESLRKTGMNAAPRPRGGDRRSEKFLKQK